MTAKAAPVVAARRAIGTLDLLDLLLIGQRRGSDSLPYPFMFTRPTRFEFVDEMAAYAAQLPERLHSGDLGPFARCLEAWAHTDVTVTGHVQYIPADVPSIRVLAFRTGQAGYLLQQHADADLVDIYTVSPFELGSAVATAMSLEMPGSHPRIVIPEFVTTPPGGADTDGVVVHHGRTAALGMEVPASRISAYANVQSTWQPSREWGVDARKESLTWIRIKDDGDYLGVPERSTGIPATVSLLRRHIDGLIDADMEALLEARGE